MKQKNLFFKKASNKKEGGNHHAKYSHKYCSIITHVNIKFCITSAEKWKDRASRAYLTERSCQVFRKFWKSKEGVADSERNKDDQYQENIFDGAQSFK